MACHDRQNRDGVAAPVTEDPGGDRALILVTLGGGGWHRQTYRVLQRYSPDEFRFAYVYGHHSGNHSARRLPIKNQAQVKITQPHAK